MKKTSGFAVKTQIRAGKGLSPGECQCNNGQEWCMGANGRLNYRGSCDDTSTGVGDDGRRTRP